MRYFLSIYTIGFLFFGNVLFSNLHLFVEHEHCHQSSSNYQDCEDCKFIDTNDNLSHEIDDLKFVFSKPKTLHKNSSLSLDSDILKSYLSRAPPR